MPAFRRSVVDDLTVQAERLEQQGPEIAAHAEQMRRTTLHFEAAELYWVTKDMTQLALDASVDMPDWTPAAILPTPIGMLAWQPGVPAIQSSGKSKVRVDVLMWAQYGGLVTLTFLHHPARLPFGGAKPPPLVMVNVAILLADEPVHPEDYPGLSGMLAMIGATWTLMEMPTMAQVRQVTGAGSSAARWRREVRQVSIIDLRRMESRPVDKDPEHSGREYTHRWYVRGHWRNQAHGPARALRRPTWVPGYIKGPDNAPLLAVEHVNVWRR